IFMGATFPFMMAYLRETNETGTDSFSYLYAANVLGAMCGTFLTAVVFVEMFGFHSTLHFAAGGNFIIALAGLALGARNKRSAGHEPAEEPKSPIPDTSNNGSVKWILF